MKKLSALLVFLVLAAGVIWLVRQVGAEERAIRGLLSEVQAAALAGANRRNPQGLDSYFATVAEGAQAAGLAETQLAYQAFVAGMPSDTTIRVHSFELSSPQVHEGASLARVTYQAHFSLERGGATLLSAKATQNLALLRTARGWRISGGDAPQLDDVTGALSR